jgi:hypothetical protein
VEIRRQVSGGASQHAVTPATSSIAGVAVLAGLRCLRSTVHQMTWNLHREKEENKGVSPRYVTGSGTAHGVELS